MNEAVENGSLRTIDGVARVYFDGYWIKRYDPPSDSLAYKKLLIQSLTRRLFNHMEHGINIPGRLLDKVRTAYEQENDPAAFFMALLAAIQQLDPDFGAGWQSLLTDTTDISGLVRRLALFAPRRPATPPRPQLVRS